MITFSTQQLYTIYKRSSGVSIDTRSISDNEIFFALSGPNFDGHNYVNLAQEKGALAAVIQNPDFALDGFTILVEDTEQALQNLARYHRLHLSCPVIGLTGSNGKTTTKEILHSILSQKYKAIATVGNLNNHLGVPLTLLSIQHDCEIGIIEMGANHIGEIKFLSEIAMPDFGLITNIGKAHLEGFGDLEGVRIGKTELYKYLDSVGGDIFLDANQEKLVSSIPEKTVNHYYSTKEWKVLSDYPSLVLEYEGIAISSQLSGVYNVNNIAAAVSVAKHFDVSLQDIKKGIESYLPSNNRSQILKTERNTLILDAYNANPSSMRASIKNIADGTAEQKILIIGHMLELGETSVQEHLSLISFINTFAWSKVYLIGNEFSLLDGQPFPIYNDVQDFKASVNLDAICDSTVLLKGSRGISLERLVPYL